MKLTVIGLGKMGSTLVQGILDLGVFKPGNITGCDLKVECRQENTEFGGISTTNNNREGVAEADIIILAIKPQDVNTVLREIEEEAADKLVISIAAGVTINHIKNILPHSTRVIRAMPNTPAMVKEGMTGITAGEQVTGDDRELAIKILKGVGEVVEVEEELMDAITGLSGSGPAYAYIMIEALADGGVLTGLSRKQSIKLAAQTLLGAARVVLETEKHPGELKDMVTSPGGTAIRGVEVLESHGIRGVIIDAIKKATKRSKELNYF